jgi:hypothetical protein
MYQASVLNDRHEHTLGTSVRSFQIERQGMSTNSALVRGGCIGTAPVTPLSAISFRTLELYRQAHRVNPRFSCEAQVRALCHLHNVSLLSDIL